MSTTLLQPVAPIFLPLRGFALALLLGMIFAGPARAQFTCTNDPNNGGSVIITGYTGAGGAVTIPSSIVTSFYGGPLGPFIVDGIANGAFTGNTSITSVTIPDSVTTITNANNNDGAFQGCSSLTNVTMGSGLTKIGTDAFEGCSSLTSVTIGSSVTSIGTFAFISCTSLTSVTIPASITSLGAYAFDNCTSLTSAAFQGNAPTMGGYVFASDPANFAVTYTYGATGFTTPTWAPDANDSYSTVVLGDPGPYTSASDGGTGLVITGYTGSGGALTIPNLIGNKTVTGIKNGAFTGNTAITSVTIPDSVTTIVDANNNDGAFQGCSNLTSVTMGSGLTKIGVDAFESCSDLTSLSLGSNVTTIGTFAFLSCTSLTSVTIPASVTSLGAYAFDNCTSLTSAVFPGNAPTMGGNVFASDPANFAVTYAYGATGFTTPTWTPDANDSYPTVVSGAPSGPYTTTSDGGTGLVITGYTGSGGALTIPGTINSKTVTGIAGSAFYGTTSLTSVTIPDSVTSIGTLAFNNCSNLSAVSIGSGVSSIGDQAFVSCPKLTTITVSNLNGSYVAAGNVLFDSGETTLIQYPTNSSATSYTVPTGITTIQDSAFYNSAYLTSVTIPSTVTSIGSGAFQACFVLNSAVFQGNAPTLGGNVFASTANNFTVTYTTGATGFTTPTWAPDANDSYTTITVSGTDLFGGVVKPSGYKKSAWFGVYNYTSYPLVYQFNLGYEYAFDAHNGGGVYLYDYGSDHFWYTQPSDFPYVYDFTLNTFLYYYQANTPHRHFYDVNTNKVITE